MLLRNLNLILLLIIISGRTAFLFESISMIEFINDSLEGNTDIKIILDHILRQKIYFKKKNRSLSNITISENSLEIDLQWAYFVVSSWSTMLCEALFLGKQCGSIFTSGWISQPPLSENYVSIFQIQIPFVNG